MSDHDLDPAKPRRTWHGARVIPAIAGLVFVALAISFLVDGSYLPAAVFVFGAAMFLKQLLRRPASPAS